MRASPELMRSPGRQQIGGECSAADREAEPLRTTGGARLDFPPSPAAAAAPMGSGGRSLPDGRGGRSMNRSLSLVACAAVLATSAPAQVATPGHLIGFTANATTNTASVTDQVLCLAPNSCPSPLPPPVQPWAGGSA